MVNLVDYIVNLVYFRFKLTICMEENITPEAPKNDATPVATPAVNATDPAEVERLKKEADQARMRANQLEKELATRKKADEEAEAERLKNNQEYQTLYEQERAKREEIERQQQADELAKAVADAKQKALADYPDEVKAIAEDTGLSLSEANDPAIAEFKAKLDKIQARLGVQRVTPNNPSTPSPRAPQVSGVEFEEMMKDPAKRDAYYRSKGGITADMMTPQQ